MSDVASPAFRPHDHAHCRDRLLDEAQRLAKARGMRITPVRLRVLELLLTSHKPLGAYEILDSLAREGLGSQPPVVYRALDFLRELGLVHKLERLNAFVACGHPGERHEAQFLVCTRCSRVAELADDRVHDALWGAAARQGFAAEAATLEVYGRCPDCTANTGSDGA